MTGNKLRSINAKAHEASERSKSLCFSDVTDEEFDAALDEEEAATNDLIDALLEYVNGAMSRSDVERLVMLNREGVDDIINRAA